MGTENFGGLDYAINVVGDWESRLADFSAQIDAIAKKSKAAAASAGGGTAGKNQDAVTKKTLALENQLKVLRSQEVLLLQAQVNLAKQTNTELVKASTAEGRRVEAKKQAVIQSKQELAAAQKLTLEVKRTKEALSKQRTSEFNKDHARALKIQERITRELVKQEAVRSKALVATKTGLGAQRTKEFNTDHTAALAIEKANQKAALYNNISAQATQKNTAAARELKIKHEQINQIMREQKISMRAAADQVGISSAQAKQLKLNMFDASHAARQFLFTFRRLVGILAIFTAARKIAQALASGVQEMARFNAEIEIAEIGIAGIVSSVGKVTDLQGNLVTGAEAFGASMEASRAIMNQLKKDAIGSIATFEALVKSYQVAIGPGLAAGLDLDQVRVLSKRLAEGAITLGVPLNQLSEEIRSLLQGTATARNTRIAVLFGGAKEANEAIRNAKEQGNLFEVLTEKLQGIAMASDAASQSFEVLKSDLQDAVQLLLAGGGIEYFNQLKESLFGLRNAITATQADGSVGFTPEALGVVQEVAGALSGIIASFRAMTDTTSTLATMRNLLGIIGDVLRAAAPLASALFQGILDGVNVVLAPVRLLGKVLGAVAKGLGIDKLNIGLLQAVKFVTQVTVGLFLWKKTLLFINGLLGAKGMLASLPIIHKLIRSISFVLAFNNVQLFTAQGLTLAWGVLMDKVAASAVLASGGLILIGAILAAVAVKMGWLDKLTNKFNNKLSDADKAAKDLNYSISGAGDATAEGAKSAKEWKDAFRDANKELAKTIALKGLVDSGKELAELFQDTLESLEDGTRQWEEQRLAAEKQLAILKEQRKELEAQDKVIGTIYKKTSIGIYGTTVIPVQADVKDDKLVKNRDALLKSTNDMREQEDLIAEARGKELDLLAIRVKNFKEANDEATRLKQTTLSDAESHLAIVDTMRDRTNVSVQNLAEAKAQTAVLKAQIALADVQRRDELKSLNERIVRSEELRKKQVEYYNLRRTQNLQAQQDVKKEQELLLAGVKNGTFTDKQAKEYDALFLRIKSLSDGWDELNKSQEGVNDQLSITKGLEDERLLALEKQKRAIDEQTAALKERERVEKRAKDLLAGSVTDAMRIGMEDFSRELPALGEQIADAISGAFSDLAGVVGGVFKDAIDPRTDADLRTAFGEFFLDLAGQFVEAITSQLVKKAVDFALNKTADAVVASPEVAALQAQTLSLTTAIQAQTTAITAAIQTSGAAGAAGAGAAGAPAIPAAPAAAAAPVSAAAAPVSAAAKASGGFFAGLLSNPLLWAIFIPILITMLAQAFKKGGKVKGYAEGGTIGGMPRPSNIPSSDTVPAWLTPGEFVIKKESVKKYGAGLLSAINNGVLNPRSFSATGLAMGGMAKGVQHFASGGGVQRASSSTAAGKETRTIITPVLVSSENHMDQMISGGRQSFDTNLNKADIIGDANRSGSW